MTTTRPGVRARGTRSGRPVMVLLDLLGRRTALRILWELRAGKPLTFRALQTAAETNPSVLNTRLTELKAVGLVVSTDAGYALSSPGAELLQLLLPLYEWSETWAQGLTKRRRGP